MVGDNSSKFVATLGSDGKVYPMDSGGNINIPDLVKYTIRTDSDMKKTGSSSSGIQTTVVDLGKQLLHFAKDSDVEGVKSLLARGAPSTSDWLGMSPLHFAAMNNQYEIATVLLKGGVNKDTKTKVDRTPLHLACYYGHERIVELLLAWNCNVNSRDMLRMTPLHWAIEKQHKNIARLLINRNADITAVSKFGKTAIALAVQTEQADMLEELEAARKAQLQREVISKTETKTMKLKQETNEAVNSIIMTDDEEAIGHVNNPDTTRNLESDDTEVAFCFDPDYSEDTLTNLDKVEETGIFDNPAIDMLKSHGISMMHEDDLAPKQMLNTALQNGRQLVLSDCGKLFLKQAKKTQNNSSDILNNNHNTTTNNNSYCNGNGNGSSNGGGGGGGGSNSSSSSSSNNNDHKNININNSSNTIANNSNNNNNNNNNTNSINNNNTNNNNVHVKVELPDKNYNRDSIKTSDHHHNNNSNINNNNNSNSNNNNNNDMKNKDNTNRTIVPISVINEAKLKNLNVSTKTRPNIIAKNKTNIGLNKNKNIRIISLNDFKKLCSQTNVKPMQTISTISSMPLVSGRSSTKTLMVDGNDNGGGGGGGSGIGIGVANGNTQIFTNTAKLSNAKHTTAATTAAAAAANNDNSTDLITEGYSPMEEYDPMSDIIQMDASNIEVVPDIAPEIIQHSTPMQFVPAQKSRPPSAHNHMRSIQVRKPSCGGMPLSGAMLAAMQSTTATTVTVTSTATATMTAGNANATTTATAAASAVRVTSSSVPSSPLAAASANTTTTTTTTTTEYPSVEEISSQLGELRKQHEELRRQFDVTNKENESMRQRLERLEEILFIEKADVNYMV